MTDEKQQPDFLPDDETKILSRKTLGDVIVEDVSEGDFIEQYATQYCEWVKGIVIKNAPVTEHFDDLTTYIHDLLSSFLSVARIGKIATAPYGMRLESVETYRQPDIQVILGDNTANLADNYLDGPADICLEIITPGSVKIDYGEKLEAYEQSGVKEYWIIDPIRKECFFHCLQSVGNYHPAQMDSSGNYSTPLLPQFQFHVPTLWADNLPDMAHIVRMVHDMLQR